MTRSIRQFLKEIMQPLPLIPVITAIPSGAYPADSGYWTNFLSLPTGMIGLIVALFLALIAFIIYRNILLRREIASCSKNEAQYRSIFENAVEGIFQSTPEGRLLRVNPSLARIAGYASAQEMIEMVTNIDQFYAVPGKQAYTHELIEQLGFIEGYELLMKRKDGDLIWISNCSRAVRDKEGKTIYYEGSVEDISNRKRAEEHIRASRKMLADLLQAACDFSIIATDPLGYVTVFNRGSELMLGYTAQEVIGKQVAMHIHLASEVEAYAEILNREYGYPVEGFRVFTVRAEKYGSETREWTFVRKNGSTLLVSLAVTPIRDESGVITGYLGIAHDITQAKRMERELQEKEARLRGITENIPGVIYQFYALDSGEYGVSFATERMRNLFDLPLDERIFYQKFLANIHDEDREAFISSIKNAVDTCSKWEFEGRYIKPSNGKTLWFHGISTPTRLKDRTVFEGFILDITENKKTLEISRQAEEKFTTVFKMAPDGIAITRLKDGVVLDMNPGFEDICGWKRDETVGRTTLDINFWVRREEREQLIEQLKAGKVVTQNEGLFRKKDGTLINGVYSSRTFKLGDEAYILFIMQDITRRKEAERRLLENEKRLSGITANLPGVVYQFFATDEGEMGMSYMSETLWEVFGLQYKDLAAVFPDFCAHMHPDDRQRLMASIEKVTRERSHWDFEGKFVKPSGEIIWFHGLSTPTRLEGKTVFDGILLDITERKHAEEQSLHVQEKFTKIFMLVPDSIVISRLADGLIMDANLGFEEITGWKRDEVLGHTTLDIDLWIDPADRRDLVATLQSRQDIVQREFQFRRRDGAIRDGIYSARPIQITGEDFLIFIVNDITRRKQIERTLLENERLLRGITTNLPGVVYQSYVDNQGKHGLSYVSEGIHEIFGLDYDDLGRLYQEFVSRIYTDDQERFAASLLEADRTVSNWNFEGRFVKPSGEIIWFQSLSTPSRHAERLVFDGILLDITERKQTEERSRLAEDKFAKIFISSPDCIVISRINGEILDVNPGFEEISGWQKAEVVGKTSLELKLWTHPDERRLVLEELKAEGILQNRELKIQVKDGRLLDMNCSVRFINIAGEDCLIFVLQDMTEQKKLEEERWKLEQLVVQSQKMDAIGQLAGGVAHDFNNILTGIQGNTSLLLMQCTKNHPHYQRLKYIEDQVERGAKLTKQLLGFARGGKYEVKVIAVNDLIKKSAELFTETKKEIEAVFNLQEDLYPVEADAGQLEQVLLNLYINAGHAMPGGGKLYISTANIALEKTGADAFEVTPGNYIKISIRDTGVGMDQATLKRIFEPFFTTKAEQGGSGLGLASAYGIIRNHSGILHADSEPGAGATFTIYLPSSRRASLNQEKSPVTDISLMTGKGRILLVDDESMILTIASEVLNMLGYTVYPAATGQEALEIFTSRHAEIDLVILDMILPGTNGEKVLKELQKIDPAVKVILASGYGLQGDVRKVMEMGCQGFIQKPYNFRELSIKVHQALNETAGTVPV